MEELSFKLTSDYIELIKLLKAEGLVPTGGTAKMAVDAGMVSVNGEVESRKRRKLRTGDQVEFGESLITIA